MSPTIPARMWLAAILALSLVLVHFFEPLSAWRFQHIQLHSTIETFGGITVCLISMMLFLESRETLDAHLIMLAAGFAGMGVLDIAHAISPPGDSFIFLHSVAGLFGAFFFASAWFTRGRRMKSLLELRFLYFGFIVLSGSVGLRALLFPGDVPRVMPLFDGQFTLAAVAINMTASLLFFIAMIKFHGMHRQGGQARDLLFTQLTLLFGIAAMIFPFSSPWNGMWWVWHLIRLIAFLATLVFLFKQYRKRLESERGAC